MKKIVIEKARLRYHAATEAFERIKASTGFDEFLPAWIEFLVQLKGIHSLFEANATPKKDPKAYGWYSQKIGERRKDPLLKYVHAARNAEEYGVEPIVQHIPGFFAIGRPGEPVHIDRLSTGLNGKIRGAKFHPVGGRLPTIVNTPSRPQLITVHDERFGDSFDPPSEHLGKPLANDSVAEVARLALAYHAELIEESERYAQ